MAETAKGWDSEGEGSSGHLRRAFGKSCLGVTGHAGPPLSGPCGFVFHISKSRAQILQLSMQLLAVR